MNEEAPKELGPTEMQFEDRVIDINDHVALYKALAPKASAMVQRIAVPARKDVLIDLLIELRISALQLGFLMQRARNYDSPGIGLATLEDFHSHLMRLASLASSVQAPSPPQLILPDELRPDTEPDEL